MKEIEDMTQDEIIALNDNDLEFLVKRRLAENGVKMMPAVESPTYPELPSKELKLFRCDLFGFESDDETFIHALIKTIDEHAPKIFFVDHDYGFDQDFAQTLGQKIDSAYNHPYDVKTRRVYPKSIEPDIREKLQEVKSLKKEYEELKKDYEANARAAQAYREDIMNVYREAQAVEHYRKRYLQLLEKDYLPLAEENREVALNFLTKAYESESHFDDEMKAYLRRKFIDSE